MLIDHALAKNPIDRYDTAEDMAADLEAINEVLKRDHVAAAIGNVKHLMDAASSGRARGRCCSTCSDSVRKIPR